MNIFRNLSLNKLALNNLSEFSEMSRIGTKSLFSSGTSVQPKLKQFETLSVITPQPFVYHVELNRPSKRNAMSHEMWLDIKNCFEILNDDEDCRSIVLSGSGLIFCSGIDLQCFMNIGQNFKETDDVARKCKTLHKMIRLYQNSLSAIEKCTKPVISAVHSACIGGGVNMVCAADIRYCSSDAWFQIKEIDLGMAADVGVVQRLPRIIGSASLTRELLYTGRKFLAREAKECGFVNNIFDTKEKMLEESIKIAVDIAAKSPVAVQTCKKSILYSQDHTIEEGLEHIATLNQTMLQSEDLMTAIMATVAKNEAPVFSKL